MKMKKLVILWTSVSEDNFFNMITPFVLDAVKEEWFHEVIVLIWGGSVQTIAKTPSIKAELGVFRQQGVTVKCCKQSANKYHLEEDLKNLDIDVVKMSFDFKDYMQEGARIISV